MRPFVATVIVLPLSLVGCIVLARRNLSRGRGDRRTAWRLGGLVFGQLGRLPRPGDRIVAGKDAFEIVEMEGRRVKSVRFLLGGGTEVPKPAGAMISVSGTRSPCAICSWSRGRGTSSGRVKGRCSFVRMSGSAFGIW